MKKKHAGGRPSALTPEVVKKLEDSFHIDSTVEDACKYAGISKVTFYKYYEKDELFMNKIDAARMAPGMKARLVLVSQMDSTNEAQALKAAMEYLRRRDPRYSDKIDWKIEGELNVNTEISFKDMDMVELEEIRKKFLDS